MTEKLTIEEREDGPLIAKNAGSMTGTDGAAMEPKPVMALCRCGASKSKPFCDGSHKDAGFKSRGGTPAGRDRLIAYEGTTQTVLYNPLICSHAAECGRIAPKAFNPKMKPWVQPDNVTPEEVRAVVSACPSGALQIASDGHLIEDRADIHVEKNGPYWVKGADLPVASPGEGGTSEKVVLCRCGLSGNKPFCDGSHRDAGWRDDA